VYWSTTAVYPQSCFTEVPLKFTHKAGVLKYHWSLPTKQVYWSTTSVYPQSCCTEVPLQFIHKAVVLKYHCSLSSSTCVHTMPLYAHALDQDSSLHQTQSSVTLKMFVRYNAIRKGKLLFLTKILHVLLSSPGMQHSQHYISLAPLTTIRHVTVHYCSALCTVSGGLLQYHNIVYFHSVDPYRITKSIWIWK
jgi:hypothetical protein